jgi:hypothetical protein
LDYYLLFSFSCFFCYNSRSNSGSLFLSFILCHFCWTLSSNYHNVLYRVVQAAETKLTAAANATVTMLKAAGISSLSTSPILTKISDKGIYKIQLKWSPKSLPQNNCRLVSFDTLSNKYWITTQTTLFTNGFNPLLTSALPIQHGCFILPIWSNEGMAQEGHWTDVVPTPPQLHFISDNCFSLLTKGWIFFF